MLTCGTYGNVLRFLPPLAIPDHLLDEALDLLDAIFEARGVSDGLLPHGWRQRSRVVDPATDSRCIAEVADGTADEATAAVDAAAAASPAWAARRPRERAETLRRGFDLMIARTDELAALICAENGKSHAEARGEVAYAAEFFRWFSEEAVRSEGDYGVAPPAVPARSSPTSRWAWPRS